MDPKAAGSAPRGGLKSATAADWQEWARSRLNALSPHRLFLIIAPLFYAAYALLTPPFETPDEHQHLFRAWQLSEFHLFGERRGDQAGGVLPEGLALAALPEIGTIEPHALRPVVERPLTTLFKEGTPPHEGRLRFFNFLGSVVYSPAGYVPQIAATWIGDAAGLSVENIVRLGRLLNGAVAIVLIYLALRLAPVGSSALIWVGLLPMTAASSAAFGQDGIVIGGACLITAIGLRVVFAGRWRRSDLVAVAALSAVLALSKIFYLPLAMIGGQPFSKRHLDWRRLVVPLLICSIAAALTGLWLYEVSSLVVPARADIPAPMERLHLWFHHPASLLGLLEHTYIGHARYLAKSLFSFGWLNVGPVRSAEFLSVLGLGAVFLVGNPGADRIERDTRLWLLLIAILVLLLISVALCIYWTRASDTWIQGLQGRYFIPIALPALIALLPNRERATRYDALVPLLMAGANLAALAVITATYYR